MKTPKEISEAVDRSIPQIQKALQGYSYLVVSDVEGAMKQRIFNQGKTEEETSIGKYKEGYYKRKREKFGRQTEYVDLEFKGDLRRSIVKGTKNGKIVIGFNNDNSAEIAEGLEERYNTTIFAASEQEAKNAAAIGEKYMIDQLTKIVQSWL